MCATWTGFLTLLTFILPSFRIAEIYLKPKTNLMTMSFPNLARALFHSGLKMCEKFAIFICSISKVVSSAKRKQAVQ